MAQESPSREQVIHHYGDRIRFGPCLVGQNLNLLTISGFAPLDRLAVISAPDEYDMVDNKLGTQRSLSKKHAEEVFDYAVSSQDVLPATEPRFFPELLLNVRTPDTIRVFPAADASRELHFDSVNGDPDIAGTVVFVEVDLDVLELPKPTKGPDISRVDGNHRLWAADASVSRVVRGEALEDDLDGDEEYPQVAFSLLVGLSPDQEAFLFRSINGEHKGMEVSHLAQLAIRIADYEKMKESVEQLPQWIAHELTLPGRAFHEMVFFGGSKDGVRRAFGRVPPVKLSTLISTVRRQVQSSKIAAARIDSPDQWLTMINRYWEAVSLEFPDAWHDHRSYILLRTIGLSAFAELGAQLVDDALQARKIEVDDFRVPLSVVHDAVSLESDSWKGIAGAGGAKVVAKELISAANADAVDKKWLEFALDDSGDDAEKIEAANRTANGDEEALE